jgi:hypothetical protein
MEPAKPPFPTPWNFSFQPLDGIHTSIVIAGVTTATTLQYVVGGAPEHGHVDIDVADLMVVSGSAREVEVRLSHVTAAAGAAAIRSPSGRDSFLAVQASTRAAATNRTAVRAMGFNFMERLLRRV